MDPIDQLLNKVKQDHQQPHKKPEPPTPPPTPAQAPDSIPGLNAPRSIDELLSNLPGSHPAPPSTPPTPLLEKILSTPKPQSEFGVGRSEFGVSPAETLREQGSGLKFSLAETLRDRGSESSNPSSQDLSSQSDSYSIPKSTTSNPIPPLNPQTPPSKPQTPNSKLQTPNFPNSEFRSRSVSRGEIPNSEFPQLRPPNPVGVASPKEKLRTQNSVLAEFKAKHEEQIRLAEEQRQRELELEQRERERLQRERRKAIEKQAEAWLKELDPVSGEGLWFERFAMNYKSRLEAAIDYLAVADNPIDSD